MASTKLVQIFDLATSFSVPNKCEGPPYSNFMYHVYLMRCSDNSIYTGITNNLEKRFLDHKAGVGAKYTRAHPVREIVYTEPFPTRGEALKREFEIKSWPRVRKLELIAGG